MNAFKCFLTLFAASSAFAQDVPPPPKPADSGPSLAATMQFIQEQLGSIGAVNYVAYFHDNTVGNDWTQKFANEVIVEANATGCRISYHELLTRNGQVMIDQDAGILLKDVTEVVVKAGEQALKESNSKAGHPEWTARMDPPVYILEVRRKIGPNYFVLYDESLANRIAKALVHAVELCGGGSKDPF